MKITRITILELVTTAITLIGVLLGTTTYYGAIIYAISFLFWWYWIYKTKAIGFIPGQIAFTIVSIWNVYNAI